MTRMMMGVVFGALVATAAIPAAASAQSQLPGQYFDPMREAPPLTVRKRPFTDSGTAVPRGYEHSYVTDQTELRRPIYSTFQPDLYGQDVLPRPFDGLGLY